MQEVTKCAPQLAIMQLGKAFENFFASRARYPVFHKKGRHDSFGLSNDQFSVEDKRIQIPKLGWVRMCEALRFKGKIMSATVSRLADRWFVSITVDVEEAPHLPKTENQGAVGVDFGVNALATLSTGEPSISGPKAHKALLRRIQRCSRSLSRKEKSSRNREKTKRKLARIHARIANIRADAMHQLTTDITRRFQIIGIEDLNVKGMLQNRHLSRAIADMSFYEFRRQLEYKAEMRDGIVVVADRWFASSKICSTCGDKLETLPLSVRQWTCPACGAEHDRDVNAAINLKKYAVSSTVSACGEEGSGLRHKLKAKPASVKQEVNSRFVQL
jgi:putative transposase